MHTHVTAHLILLLMASLGFAGEVLVDATGTLNAPNVTVARTTDATPAEAVRGSDTRLIPVGTVLPFAGSTAPPGYALCNGSVLSRTTNASLFAVIGTTYGAGDGSTTFTLPNLAGRFPIGAGPSPGLTTRTIGSTGGTETHTLTVAQIPPHSHTVRSNGAPNSGSGAIMEDHWSGGPVQTSQTGGGQPFPLMPPFVSLNFIIKL